MEASKRAEYVKSIHMKTKQEIEKKSKHYAAKANKNRKRVTFQPGDLVWVHLRKDRFPEKQKSKLLPRGDGPFKVLAKINDNAYKIELPGDDYAVSNTFNVADLSPFFGPEESELRSTLFEEGEDDEDIQSDEQDSPHDGQDNDVYKGPFTRARAQLLQDEVNLVLNKCEHTSTKNYLLPNGSAFLILRFQEEAMGNLSL